MSGELVRREDWDKDSKKLIELYAGFSDADELSDEEKVISLLSLIPMALEIVDEARDTIERLNGENEALKEYKWMYEDLS